MSLDPPKCSFCSSHDSLVQVVCEGMCLICHKCQLLPATRKLLINYSSMDPNRLETMKNIQNGALQSTKSLSVKASNKNLLAMTLNTNDSKPLSNSSKNINNNNNRYHRNSKSDANFNNLSLVKTQSESLIQTTVPFTYPKTHSSGQCPLCLKPLARNMAFVIKDFVDRIKADNDGVEGGPDFRELELGYEDNKFVPFYSYFRETYGTLGKEVTFEENTLDIAYQQSLVNNHGILSVVKERKLVESGITDDSSGSSDDESNVHSQKHNGKKKRRPVRPGTSDSSRAVSHHNNNHTLSSQESLTLRETSFMDSTTKGSQLINAANSSILTSTSDNKYVSQPTLSPTKAMSFIASCFCHLWQCLIRGDYRSMTSVSMRISNRKKSSLRSNDLRTKSILDYMSSAVASKISLCYLFARLVGLQPKPMAYSRPALGSIATVVFVIAYCGDTIMSSKQLIDANGSPTVAEFRAKLNKFATVKSISLKHAFEIVQFMTSINQPHWVMSPLTAAIVEFNARLPWGSDSIARLIHLLYYTVTMDGENSRPSTGDGTHRSRREGNNNNNINANNNFSNAFNSNNSNFMSNNANNKFDNKKRRAEIAPLSKLKLLPAKARDLWQAVPNISMHPDHRKTVSPIDLSSLGKVSFEDSVSGGSNAVPPSRGRLAMTLNNTALSSTSMNGKPMSPSTSRQGDRSEEGSRVPTSVNTHTNTSNNLNSTSSAASSPQRVSTANGNLHSAVATSAEDPSTNTVGTFAFVDWDQAKALSGDLTISVADLAFALITAWEAEHDAVMSHLNRALLSGMRRFGIKGTFDQAITSISAHDRYILTRLINWYSARGQDGIDWLQMKEQALRQEFPFAVPQSMMDMSAAALEYHANKIREARKLREMQEEIEDLFDTDGPYAPKGWRLNTPGFSRGNVEMSDNEWKTAMRVRWGSQTSDGVNVGECSEDNRPITAAELEAIARAEYLARQTLGTKEAKRDGNAKQTISPSSSADILVIEYPENPSEGGQEVMESGEEQLSAVNEQVLMDMQDVAMQTQSLSRAQTPAVNTNNDTYTTTANRPLTPGSFLRGQIQSPVVEAQDLFPGLRASLPGARSRFIPRPAYVSPHPGKHDVHLVDIVDNSEDILKRANLLDENIKVSVTDDRKTFVKGPTLDEDLVNSSLMPFIEQVKGTHLRSTVEMSRPHTVSFDESRTYAAKSRLRQRLRTALGDQDAAREALDSLSLFETIPSKQGLKDSFSAETLTVLDIDDFEQRSKTISHQIIFDCAKHVLWRDKVVTSEEFKSSVDKYLTFISVSNMKILEFSDLKFGFAGSKLIAQKFRSKSNLVELHLPGNLIGDLGIIKIVESLISTKSQGSLISLDIENNDITFANDRITILGQLPELKYLNLGRNKMSFDTARAKQSFSKTFHDLSGLRYLSLAYNTLQDHMFELLLDQILDKYSDLRCLNLNRTFLTGKSIPAIHHFVRVTNKPSSVHHSYYSEPSVDSIHTNSTTQDKNSGKDIFLALNLFTLEQKTEMEHFFKQESSCYKIYFDGEPARLAEFMSYDNR